MSKHLNQVTWKELKNIERSKKKRGKQESLLKGFESTKQHRNPNLSRYSSTVLMKLEKTS